MMGVETMLARLDRLAGQHVPSILRLDPQEVDPIIDAVLAEIGEILGVEQAVFAAAADSTSCRTARTWMRPGSMIGGAALTVPVAVAGQRLGVLTVGPAANGLALPLVIEERLRTIAELMTLTVQCGERILALSRHGDDLAHPVVGDDGVDGGDFEDVIGDSPLLRFAIGRVLEVAPTDASVVLMGETGTGKELFARAVHNRSQRRARPFVRVNCAALPPTLIETELFGHERGAFTGAVSMRRGRFEMADRGTLFLDEIGDLPLDVQAKLLRVLQEGEFERVGASESRKVDVRVVAATHYDLEAAVKEGRFRLDLYYRLNVFPIALPPLRERASDIPRLTWYFINRRQRALNRKITSIPPAVLAALQNHSWPGNVRELENVVERAMIHSTGESLQLDDGPSVKAWRPASEGTTLEEVERQHIERVLLRCRWRVNGPGNAAETLGMHPNTLRFRMKKLGIERPRGPISLDAGRIPA